MIPLEAWVQAAQEHNNEHLAPIVAMLCELDPQLPDEQLANILTPDRALNHVDSTRSHKQLAKAGVQPPIINTTYAQAAIAFFEAHGQLSRAASR